MTFEVPLLTRSTDTALKVLGGSGRLSSTLANAGLDNAELWLRPDDPFSHPISGDRRPACGFLLRVRTERSNVNNVATDADATVVVPCTSSDPAGAPIVSRTASIVGVVEGAYRFEALADFQFLPKGVPLAINGTFVTKYLGALHAAGSRVTTDVYHLREQLRARGQIEARAGSAPGEKSDGAIGVDSSASGSATGNGGLPSELAAAGSVTADIAASTSDSAFEAMAQAGGGQTSSNAPTLLPISGSESRQQPSPDAAEGAPFGTNLRSLLSDFPWMERLGASLNVIPPVFSSISRPMPYSYAMPLTGASVLASSSASSSAAAAGADGEGAVAGDGQARPSGTLTLDRRTIYSVINAYHVFAPGQPVPSAPRPTPPTVAFAASTRQRLAAAFAVRPAWTTSALMLYLNSGGGWDAVAAEDDPLRNPVPTLKTRPVLSEFKHVRPLLPGHAYYMRYGPYRCTWLRLGWDPRSDPASRLWQVVDVRIPSSHWHRLPNSIISGQAMQKAKAGKAGGAHAGGAEGGGDKAGGKKRKSGEDSDEEDDGDDDGDHDEDEERGEGAEDAQPTLPEAAVAASSSSSSSTAAPAPASSTVSIRTPGDTPVWLMLSGAVLVRRTMLQLVDTLALGVFTLPLPSGNQGAEGLCAPAEHPGFTVAHTGSRADAAAVARAAAWAPLVDPGSVSNAAGAAAPDSGLQAALHGDFSDAAAVPLASLAGDPAAPGSGQPASGGAPAPASPAGSLFCGSTAAYAVSAHRLGQLDASISRTSEFTEKLGWLSGPWVEHLRKVLTVALCRHIDREAPSRPDAAAQAYVDNLAAKLGRGTLGSVPLKGAVGRPRKTAVTAGDFAAAASAAGGATPTPAKPRKKKAAAAAAGGKVDGKAVGAAPGDAAMTPAGELAFNSIPGAMPPNSSAEGGDAAAPSLEAFPASSIFGGSSAVAVAGAAGPIAPASAGAPPKKRGRPAGSSNSKPKPAPGPPSAAGAASALGDAASAPGSPLAGAPPLPYAAAVAGIPQAVLDYSAYLLGAEGAPAFDPSLFSPGAFPDAAAGTGAPAHKRRGRPPGVKSKPKLAPGEAPADGAAVAAGGGEGGDAGDGEGSAGGPGMPAWADGLPKKRGRPAGSKNKPKADSEPGGKKGKKSAGLVPQQQPVMMAFGEYGSSALDSSGAMLSFGAPDAGLQGGPAFASAGSLPFSPLAPNGLGPMGFAGAGVPYVGVPGTLGGALGYGSDSLQEAPWMLPGLRVGASGTSASSRADAGLMPAVPSSFGGGLFGPPGAMPPDAYAGTGAASAGFGASSSAAPGLASGTAAPGGAAGNAFVPGTGTAAPSTARALPVAAAAFPQDEGEFEL